MTLLSKIESALIEGISSTGQRSENNALLMAGAKTRITDTVKVGIVRQFNVGLYSAIVSDGISNYTCYFGSDYVTTGFGYSDMNLLREGDLVIFSVMDTRLGAGVILARKPTLYKTDGRHKNSIQSDTDMERRTHFFSNETYRKKQSVYVTPQQNKKDTSTKVYTSNRPTDLVPGEWGHLNQHHCGILGGLYSTSLFGGMAHIRLSALENRIRVVADSLHQYLTVGNRVAGHNRRYLTDERSLCLYMEERLGLNRRDLPAFEELDKNGYHDEFYFTKNKEKKQTAKPRFIEHMGYYGGLYSRFFLQPDPDGNDVRTLDEDVKDPGVLRESIDPSGQYRLASVGMLGFERIGRIPVPIRQVQVWEKDAQEPEAKALTEFKHDEGHPYYRQLEHADRVAYDLKNSYARYDEEKSGFTTPQEKDLEGKVRDVYDQGFTDSTTARVEKYDKRRSGVWQGEDGSIIIRDAWGSEIVMIGGNIQLSCAGNVLTLPGKTALTLAGDDIVQKAQKSIDIHAAKNDVRIDAHTNVQIMGGTDGETGGITLESRGTGGVWDATSEDGGEGLHTSGIFLKATEGSVVTDVKNLILTSKSYTLLGSGEESMDGSDGSVYIVGESVITYGQNVFCGNETAAVGAFGDFAFCVGSSAILDGSESSAWISGGEYPIPLDWADVGDMASTILDSASPILPPTLGDETVCRSFTPDKLENMYFKFRSSEECGTDGSWELDGDKFTLYEPFWVQVSTKFETLKGSVQTQEFEDCENWKGSDRGVPWPGESAADSGVYAQISGLEPTNLDEYGFNKPRDEVADSTPVEELPLSGNYKVRQ